MTFSIPNVYDYTLTVEEEIIASGNNIGDAPESTAFGCPPTVSSKPSLKPSFLPSKTLSSLPSSVQSAVPSATPSEQPSISRHPSACKEDPDQKIVAILNENADFFATCGLLSQNPEYFDSVCCLKPAEVAKSLSPVVVCPKTCGDSNAKEDPNAVVIGLLQGTDVKRGDCAFLASLPQDTIDIACNLEFSIWDKYDAPKQCECTCG